MVCFSVYEFRLFFSVDVNVGVSRDGLEYQEVDPQQRKKDLEQICLGNATIRTTKTKRKVGLENFEVKKK